MKNSVSNINQLDEDTINKIAAGEVIERPASVVKELIDNSVDAEASIINIEIDNAGSDTIAVIDNGVGLSKADATLAFKKYSTSKIKNIKDLDKLATFGFRGEALASIASVSNIELVTRKKSMQSGLHIFIDNGSFNQIYEVGANVGTKIIVRNLFYNTPVRKKYLKSKRTENSHIVDVITKHSIGNPSISFKLKNDGKQLLNSPGSKNLLDTIVHLFGSELAKSLIPLEAELDDIRLTGYVAKPNFARSNNDQQYIYVNNKPVSSSSISNAIKLGYYTKIPKGRYPIAFIKVEVNPEHVDFNVHPTKAKVRLFNENKVLDFITTSVEKALSESSDFLYISKKKKQPKKTHETNDIINSSNHKKNVSASFSYTAKDTQKRIRDSEKRLAKNRLEEDEKSNLTNIEIVEQFDDTYILAKMNDSLVIIDQHAAHERIIYEQLKFNDKITSQELISPITLDLTPKEKEVIEEYIPYLEKEGFEIIEFGPSSYAVSSVPQISYALEDPKSVLDIISDLIQDGIVNDDTTIRESIIKKMACRGAIKSGAKCNFQQMKSLLSQLALMSDPLTCPHGRPTIIAFDRDEIDKMFKRK